MICLQVTKSGYRHFLWRWVDGSTSPHLNILAISRSSRRRWRLFRSQNLSSGPENDDYSSDEEDEDLFEVLVKKGDIVFNKDEIVAQLAQLVGQKQNKFTRNDLLELWRKKFFANEELDTDQFTTVISAFDQLIQNETVTQAKNDKNNNGFVFIQVKCVSEKWLTLKKCPSLTLIFFKFKNKKIKIVKKF